MIDAIAAQAIRHDIELVIHEDRMRLVTERFRATGKIEDGVPEIGTGDRAGGEKP